MKRNWTIDELIDHWTLTPGEREMAKRAIGVNNQLGRALLLKWFQYAGREDGLRLVQVKRWLTQSREATKRKPHSFFVLA